MPYRDVIPTRKCDKCGAETYCFEVCSYFFCDCCHDKVLDLIVEWVRLA